jgi:pyrimidine operon attenuation protein / uracil phosphoribosyltransferase
MNTKPNAIMEKEDIVRVLRRVASQILERNRGLESVVIVGIRTRGYTLACRLGKMLQEMGESQEVPVGALDIGLYRDDLSLRSTQPLVRSSDIPFSIDAKHVILVDDVLYTGRSVRASLNALADYGRTSSIQLAVLIDRGHRELPVRADYTGMEVRTRKNETVQVLLEENDEMEMVQLCSDKEANR